MLGQLTKGSPGWAVRVHHRAASPCRQTQALTLGTGHDGLDRRLQRLDDSAPRVVGEGPFVVADDEDAPPCRQGRPGLEQLATSRHSSSQTNRQKRQYRLRVKYKRTSGLEVPWRRSGKNS
jgi:hypothetical protein